MSPSPHAFPIPVVAASTAAVHPPEAAEAAPEYLAMPHDMATFNAPRLPEATEPALLAAVVRHLRDLRGRMAATDFLQATKVTEDLLLWSEAERALAGDLLGFGEVSAYTHAPEALQWRIQETAFAGLWRVLALDDAETIHRDFLQAGAIPPVLADTMRTTSQPALPLPDFTQEGIMNAPALAHEIVARAATHGAPTQVINLTLLPVSEADLDILYAWLGHRAVSILSRGYGNCRITSTRLANVWWVQYFNSMDALILNTLEITPMPAAALAAREDYEDTLARLDEYLRSLAEA
ncbi:MAG: hydrogenase expression/formation protein [Zoogloeaceae bacterium]|jgi:hydrogenase-1 operon protein HyaF|nr:hydrogenase expression/formation protein [Zoogloeaceae bacterium]